MQELIRIHVVGPAPTKPVLLLVDPSRPLSALMPQFLRKLQWTPDRNHPPPIVHHAESSSILDPALPLRQTEVRDNHTLYLVPLAAKGAPGARKNAIEALKEAAGEAAEGRRSKSDLEALLPAAIDAAVEKREKIDVGRVIWRRELESGTAWAVRMLRDPDDDVREQALRILTRLRPDDRVQEIRPLLRDPSGPVRGAAARALRRLDRPESVDPEIAALATDPDPAARRGAAEALSDLQVRGREARLLPLLDDPDLSVRAEALKSLADLDAPAVRQLLPVLLGDPNPEVRAAACDAAARLEAREAIPGLIENLRHGDPSVRRNAIYAVIDLRAREAADALRERLGDDDLMIRSQALHALTTLGTVEAKDALRFVADESSMMKSGAITALAKLGATREIQPLLGDKDPSIQAAACEALGGPDEIRRLREFLTHPVTIVRLTAAAGLGRLGVREAAPEIARLLQDSQDPVQAAAVNALVQLDYTPAARSIVPLLAEERYVRRWASDALLELGTAGEIAPDLVRLLAAHRPHTRLEAIRLLQDFGARSAAPSLLPLLRDPGRWVRKAAVEAIAHLGSESSAAEVRTLLRDENSHVRFAAAAALAVFGDRSALRAAIPDRDLERADCRLLNGVREPALWRRLDDLPIEADLSGPPAGIVTALAKQSGLRVDLGPIVSATREGFHFRARSGISVLTALDRVSRHEFLLEPGRIRMVSERDAVAEWAAWLQRLA